MFKNYLKTAWRNLLANKTSAIINVGGLAIGLATAVIILLLIVNEFSYDKFNTNLQSIYLLMKNQKRVDGISTGDVTAGPIAASIRSNMPESKYVSRVRYFDNAVIKIKDKALYASGIYTEPDLFNMMTLPTVEGNAVNALKNGSEVVMTEAAALKLFGSKNVFGKQIVLNKNPFIVGAVVHNIPSKSTIQFEIAFPFSYFEKQNDWLNKWDDNRIQTWVQLKPASNVALLNQKLTTLLQTRSNDKSVSLFAYPLARLHLYGGFNNGKPDGGEINVLIMLAALGIFIILIACINFMNIATARSERRGREVGVRKVLGASRKRIIFQFLSEAMLITFIAILLAVVIAKLCLPYFNQLAGKNIDFNFYDGKVWLLLAATGIFTALVAGSYPSFFLSSFKPIKVLKGSFINRKGGGLRRMLVTVQFIISIFFIVATIIVYKQINFVHNRPIGYDKDNLIDINATGDLNGKFDLLKNELKKINGVESITAGTDNLINFGGGVTGIDYPGKIPGEDISVITSNVSYEWTKTMHIPILEGRDFDPSFGTDSSACIINEATIKKMNLKEPVVGDMIGGKNVIGVFKDFVYNNPSGIIAPMVISFQQNNFPHFFVRIANNNNWHATLSMIEGAAKKLNPDYPFDFSFVKDNYQERFEEWNSWSSMTTLFACMAVFIAALGLFGLASFVAERRSKEVSIRKVFGADSKTIWLLLSRDFFKPVLIATAIVIPLSILISYKFLLNITYHTPLEWWMFALAVAATILIALITISFQSIKAAIANPVKNLRTE